MEKLQHTFEKYIFIQNRIGIYIGMTLYYAFLDFLIEKHWNYRRHVKKCIKTCNKCVNAKSHIDLCIPIWNMKNLWLISPYLYAAMFYFSSARYKIQYHFTISNENTNLCTVGEISSAFQFRGNDLIYLFDLILMWRYLWTKCKIVSLQSFSGTVYLYF